MRDSASLRQAKVLMSWQQGSFSEDQPHLIRPIVSPEITKARGSRCPTRPDFRAMGPSLGEVQRSANDPV